jgi:hypothetical protein
MNETQLEKRLRFAFECSTIVWAAPKHDQFAAVLANAGEKTIYLPSGYDDDYTLRTLFHELCHIAIPGELGAFGVFEEDILLRVLEPRLMHHLVERPRKHAWWLRKLQEVREQA